MKKIRKVSFSDFRVFYGNVSFDFTTKVGRTADFICIYGQNGMGKSSFFDGIEWGFTGKIHRLDNDIKTNVAKYSGDILKNIYSSNEYASVEVEFDDDEIVKRKIKKRVKSMNDYGQGSFSPRKYVKILSEKQILPHNKIDSFVYATNPSDKYNEWGEFWDPEGKERKIFKTIYKIKKQCEIKIASLEKEMIENEKSLDSLILDEAIIEELNDKIQRYNIMSPLKKQKIDIIEKVEYARLILPKKDQLIFFKKELISTKDNLNLDISKLKFLANNFLVNSRNRLEEDRLIKLIKKWKKIIEYCKQKEEYKNKYNYMIGVKQETDINVKDILQVYNCGNEWMNKYQYYNNMNENIKSISKQIKVLNEKNKYYTEKFEDDLKKISKLSSIYEELTLKKEKLISAVEIRNRLEDKIELLKREIIKLDNKEKKLQIIINDEYNEINIFEDFCEKVNDVKNYRNPDILSIELLNTIGEYVDKSYLNEYKALQIEKSNQKELILNLEKKYTQSQEALNNLQSILVNVKNYISENMMSTCPVCAAEYNETDILLSKINSTVQQEYSQKIYKELNTHKNCLAQIEVKQINILIILSNLCRKLINERNSNRGLILDFITLVKNEIITLKSKIENSNLQVLQAKDLIMSEGLDEKINNEEVNIWLNKKKEKICKEIEQIEVENKHLSEEKIFTLNKIKTLEEDIEKNSLEYENFVGSSDNNILIKIIEQNKIKTWVDLEKLYFNLKCKLENNNNEISKIETYLDKVSFISVDKQSSYVKQLERVEERYEEIKTSMRTYREYANHLFRNENINLRQIQSKLNRIERCLERALEKIDIINDILSQVSIDTYNQEYDNLMIKKAEIVLEQKKFIEGKEKIDSIFNQIKNKIETNVEYIFSSNIMNEIYRKIEPHKNFETLRYEVCFNDNDQPEIYIKGASKLENIDVMPELFYSSAQLNTVALSSFLGEALCMHNAKVKTIFIDDPVGHFDDINILAFVDLVRAIVSESNWQVVMSTHDESLFNLFKNKLPEEYYNAKYIQFTSLGQIESI